MLQVDGKGAEIGLVAAQDHVVHRRVGGCNPGRLEEIVQSTIERRQQLTLVGLKRERKASAAAHDVAGEFRLFRTDRLEPYGARITVEDGGDIDEVDRLFVDLALAALDHVFDEAPQPETVEIAVHFRL